MSSLIYIKASCHCGLNAFQIPFDTAKLPHRSDLCQCNTCRHLTGSMVQTAWIESHPLAIDADTTSESPLAEKKKADLTNLKKYNVTPELTRYYCSKCSTYMLNESSHWSVSVGALERVEGIAKVGYHAFLGDTLDGGVADHYRKLDGVDIPRYEGDEGTKTLPVGWKAESILAKPQPSLQDDRLTFSCLCKAISLYITRPDQEKAKVPEKWWMAPADEADPSSRPRFVAGHCFCPDCRLSSGTVFAPWVIVERVNVFDSHTGLPVKLDLPKDGSENPNRPKGLKQYESSPETFRESCATCGANAIYWTRNLKNSHWPLREGELEVDVIDLAGGLIDQEVNGARAERWVKWHETPIYAELAIDKTAAAAVAESLKLI